MSTCRYPGGWEKTTDQIMERLDALESKIQFLAAQIEACLSEVGSIEATHNQADLRGANLSGKAVGSKPISF